MAEMGHRHGTRRPKLESQIQVFSAKMSLCFLWQAMLAVESFRGKLIWQSSYGCKRPEERTDRIPETFHCSDCF